MFCNQCQEAAGGKGCTQIGVCGKSDDVSNYQDLLIFALKGLAGYNHIARKNGLNKALADHIILDGLFTTITNANFDASAIIRKIKMAIGLRKEIETELKEKGIQEKPVKHIAMEFDIPESDYLTFSKEKFAGIKASDNEDINSLRQLIIFGVKGIAAYTDHAGNLGFQNDEICEFIERALLATLDDSLSSDALVSLVLETGSFGVKGMALLDEANTTKYGHPELTEVNIGVSDKPAILISGHDLRDLEMLLEQTDGTGVDVYTHSEMLPGHYYPAFKKYDHFIGNYGNAWWKQKEEFEKFNGPILFTTNCIVPPKASYSDRVYTTGSSGFEGFKHIELEADGVSKDFSEIIAHAKKTSPPTEIETGKIVGGFAHNQVMALADTVVDAVKSGAIKQFFVMAGCDGRMKSRVYYEDFAKALPNDTVILTAGCAKYRYNKLNLGDIGGIPRVLDAGQCNDSYSLALIALKLKEVFELEDINELPISFNIAWYEQKAVIVLLALLYLGVKDIKLGPTLPAFLSPNVANVLVDTFGINGITTVEEDMVQFLG